MSNQCNCTICGKVFEADKITKLCYTCRQSDRHLFGMIRDFLYDNPGASINEVVDFTGVTSSVVLKYLREGRLQTVGKMKVLNCDDCGVPIDYGNRCEACEQKNTHRFKSAGNVQHGNTKQTMHIGKKKK